VFAKAAADLIAKGKAIAALVMGAAPETVAFDDGRFVSRDTNRTFEFLELAREAAHCALPEALKDGIAVVTDNEMHEPVFPTARQSARSRSTRKPAGCGSPAMPRSTMSGAASIR